MREDQLREEQRRLQELKDNLDLQAVKDRERYGVWTIINCTIYILGSSSERRNVYKNWKRKEFYRIN